MSENFTLRYLDNFLTKLVKLVSKLFYFLGGTLLYNLIRNTTLFLSHFSVFWDLFWGQFWIWTRGDVGIILWELVWNFKYGHHLFPF